jgi:hypothetical protein
MCCGKRMPWDRKGVHLSWKSFLTVEEKDRCERCNAKVYRR